MNPVVCYYFNKSRGVFCLFYMFSSPAPEIKHANMSMRANLRQQLQRQQMLEIEKRERENSLGSLGKQSQTQPQNINGPVLHGPPEVPPKVLQVCHCLLYMLLLFTKTSIYPRVLFFLTFCSPQAWWVYTNGWCVVRINWVVVFS